MNSTEPMPRHDAPAVLHAYRLIVWAVVAVATVLVLLVPRGAAPEPPVGSTASVTDDHKTDFADAETLYDWNAGSADSAPKQQVVNGWYTNDLLQIIGSQLDAIQQTQGRALKSQEANAALAADGHALATAQRESMIDLLAILGMGAAAHLGGSSLILLLARRPRRAQTEGPEYPTEPVIPEPTGLLEPTSFDPRPGA